MKCPRGKVKFVIKRRSRAMVEYLGEEDCCREYWKRNWSKKIIRERRKAAEKRGKK